MATFLYSPGVRVFIETTVAGTIEVTDDISRGTLALNENAPSMLSLSITNARRKYDGLFTPNDRISVRMKRINWLQVFSGYLGAVPMFSTYPRTIQITAMDSLKRLKYHPWDSGAVESWNLLHTIGQGQDGMSDVDGGLGQKIKVLLTDVAGWPANQIHLGRLPDKWFQNISDLFNKVADTIQVDQSTLGASSTIAGSNPLDNGTSTVPGVPGTDYRTGVLPATSGIASSFGGVGTTDATGHMGLSGESGTNPIDVWYCAMRWPYVNINPNHCTPANDGFVDNTAYNWWKRQKVLVVNPLNNKAVVLRAADWGPGVCERVLDMSPQAMQYLGGNGLLNVLIRFAAENATPGPVADAAAAAAQGVAPGTNPNSIDTPGVTGAAAATTPLMQNYTIQIKDRLPVDLSWGYPNGEIPDTALRRVAGTIHELFPPAAASMEQMMAAAKRDGVTLSISDAYRNLQGQKNAKADAIRKGRPDFAATPGHSNHGMGFACDMNMPGAESDPAYVWMKKNAAQYGWVHPPYMEPGAAGPHEPWHWEFWAAPNFIDNGQYNPDGTPPAATAATPTQGAPTNLLNAFNWYGQPDPGSSVLAGPRALMNDEPVLNTAAMMCNTSMRSFMAAPNGDFISWFPDYFGVYDTAGKMIVHPIEIMGDGFTVMWDDERLVTHQFTAGSATGFSTGALPGGAVDIYQQYMTLGIATVEFPELMKALFNIDASDPRAAGFLDPAAIFQRFGARPDFKPMGTITGPQAEFWYACWLFQQNWASQFSSAVPLTFMPEVFPGMLLQLPAYGFQCYVEAVQHSFDFGPNGGFTTQVRIVAPSALDGSGLYGLPRAKAA